jgi:hypothetical protein
MGPDIRAVEGNVDGKITEKMDALFPAAGPKVQPLAVEQVLLDSAVLDRNVKILPKAIDLGGPSMADARRPAVPSGIWAACGQRREQGIVVEPVRILGAKAIVAAVGQAPSEAQAGFLQQAALEGRRLRIVDPVLRHAAPQRQIPTVEQLFRGEDFRADQQGIEGEARHAVVRRMAEGGLGRVHGQYLPDPLAGGMQEIHKPECAGSEIPDSERRRQAEYGQQNAAGA